MQIIYTLEDVPETINRSLFLAGPSPRPEQTIHSWRVDALEYLESIDFDGVVFVPEYKPNTNPPEFDLKTQIEWEERCLNASDCIVFWVPRDLEQLPAFTTNIEFGAWCNSGKIVFGAPDSAPKNDYIKYYCNKYNVPLSNDLNQTLDNAISKTQNYTSRTDGERFVPLFIWNSTHFQSWYSAQKQANNKLIDARLLFSFRPDHKFPFLWVLKCNVFIQSENRNKTNEFVVSRPDISSVLLYKMEPNLQDSKIIIIKEFRTPAATNDGFIRELIGGSSKSNKSNAEVALDELQQETGFELNPYRLHYQGSRQLCGTLSSHKCHLYSAEINEQELTWFENQKNIPHGVEEDSEKTYVEIYSIKEILNNNDFDWNVLGMIFKCTNQQNQIPWWIKSFKQS